MLSCYDCSQRWIDHDLSGQLGLVLDHSHSKKVLYHAYMEFLVFQFSPTASLPHLYPIWYLYIFPRSPQSLLFLRLSNPSFLSISPYDRTRHSTAEMAHQQWVGGKKHLPWGQQCYSKHSKPVLAATAQGQVPGLGKSCPPSHPSSIFLQSCFPATRPPKLHWHRGLCPPGTRLHIPLWGTS